MIEIYSFSVSVFGYFRRLPVHDSAVQLLDRIWNNQRHFVETLLQLNFQIFPGENFLSNQRSAKKTKPVRYRKRKGTNPDLFLDAHGHSYRHKPWTPDRRPFLSTNFVVSAFLTNFWLGHGLLNSIELILQRFENRLCAYMGIGYIARLSRSLLSRPLDQHAGHPVWSKCVQHSIRYCKYNPRKNETVFVNIARLVRGHLLSPYFTERGILQLLKQVDTSTVWTVNNVPKKGNLKIQFRVLPWKMISQAGELGKTT